MANYILARSFNRANIQNRLYYAMDSSDLNTLKQTEKLAFGDRVYVIKAKTYHVLGNDNTWYEIKTDSSSGLPDTEAADNGKVLTVVNSKWQKADAYSLPTASASTLGGIKVGDGLSISNGKLSADKKKTQMYNWINGMISESQGVCSFTAFTAPTAEQLKTAWANGEEPVLYIATFTVGTTLFPAGVVLPLVPTNCLLGGNPFDTGSKPTFSGLVKADNGLYAVFVGFDVASGFFASASCEVVKLTT